MEAHKLKVVTTKTPRRVALSSEGTKDAQSIYRRADGGLEIGYRDEDGKQRWKAVDGGIQAARKVRDDLKAKKNRGEVVSSSPVRFGEAADDWLEKHVSSLRSGTQRTYADDVKNHLRPRFDTRKLESIKPDDAAKLVRDLRDQGLAETTNARVVMLLGQVFKWAGRYLGYSRANPVALMHKTERPKVSQTKKRRIYEAEEIAQTVQAADSERRTNPKTPGYVPKKTTPPKQWSTLFSTAAMTGLRVGELLGLTREDVSLTTPATLSVEAQIDHAGNRVTTKTEESKRTVRIPQSLATVLKEHLTHVPKRKDALVFATRDGKPLTARNVSHSLRIAQRRAKRADGTPTFPILHEKDANGKPVKIPKGTLPSMHGFRHAYASYALADGDSMDEVAFLLGHRDGTVTRTVYAREVADARRAQQRTDNAERRYGSILEAADA